MHTHTICAWLHVKVIDQFIWASPLLAHSRTQSQWMRPGNKCLSLAAESSGQPLSTKELLFQRTSLIPRTDSQPQDLLDSLLVCIIGFRTHPSWSFIPQFTFILKTQGVGGTEVLYIHTYVYTHTQSYIWRCITCYPPRKLGLTWFLPDDLGSISMARDHTISSQTLAVTLFFSVSLDTVIMEGVTCSQSPEPISMELSSAL